MVHVSSPAKYSAEPGACDGDRARNPRSDPKGPPTANVLLDGTEGSIREAAIVGCTIQHSTGCLVSDARTPPRSSVSLRAAGGRGNVIVRNILRQGWNVATGAAHLEANR